MVIAEVMGREEREISNRTLIPLIETYSIAAPSNSTSSFLLHPSNLTQVMRRRTYHSLLESLHPSNNTDRRWVDESWSCGIRYHVPRIVVVCVSARSSLVQFAVFGRVFGLAIAM
jgi:hypothetical protein